MAYFVKIDDPREFRRDLLESSRQIIGCLQANRAVLRIREQKRALLKDLQTDMKELALLITELDKLMPDKHLRDEVVAREAPVTVAKKKSSKRKGREPVEDAEPAPDDDVAKLNEALAKIERKLSSL